VRVKVNSLFLVTEIKQKVYLEEYILKWNCEKKRFCTYKDKRQIESSLSYRALKPVYPRFSISRKK